MPHILIVGKSHSGIKQYLLENNINYTLLQDEAATKYPQKRFKNRVVCSFKDKASVLVGLEHIKKPIDGVVCVYENYVLATAWITNALKLPGMSEISAETCTDKELMRKKFQNSSEEISPAFTSVSSESELINFANSHDFPLILKPANLAKSLFVTKNANLEELLINYRKATGLLNNAYAKYAPNRVPKLIVEEFLEGSIHSVDAFIDATGEPHILNAVVDYRTGYDIGYDDNFHYSRVLPSQLSEHDKASIWRVAKLGCEALEMKSSPAHIEIILTAKGPRIVEIGARNGGYRERMHRYANGIDIIGNHIAIALGNRPNITATLNKSCAVLEIFPKQIGRYNGISNHDQLMKLQSLMYISVKVKPGEYIGKSSDGYKMSVVLMLGNPDFKTLKTDLDYVLSNVAIVTKN